jgi:hypothetical protein
VMLASTWAVRSAARAIDLMHRMSGTNGIYRGVGSSVSSATRRQCDTTGSFLKAAWRRSDRFTSASHRSFHSWRFDALMVEFARAFRRETGQGSGRSRSRCPRFGFDLPQNVADVGVVGQHLREYATQESLQVPSACVTSVATLAELLFLAERQRATEPQILNEDRSCASPRASGDRWGQRQTRLASIRPSRCESSSAVKMWRVFGVAVLGTPNRRSTL